MVKADYSQLIGKRFGRLQVLKHHSHALGYECLCDCGNTIMLKGNRLLVSGCKSCGCLRKEIRHKYCKTPTWNSWRAMIKRCTSPKDPAFQHYGGRGITVCERWRDSFVNFLSDMGERPHGRTLGRIENNGNYEPGNCAWQTNAEQSVNKRTTKLIVYKGISKSLRLWCNELKIDYRSVNYRLRNGWSVPETFETPFRKCGRELELTK